jgi:Mrp family chromosome partitioning ATPase
MSGGLPLFFNKPRQLVASGGGRSPEPFGQTAVRLGYASSSAVLQALREQEGRKAAGENVLLGLLMVDLGILTPAQLADVLRQFRYERYAVTEDALRLAARLKVLLQDQDKDQVVLMISVGAHAGTSQVVAQTALAMALMGRGKVLLVDAHPRTRVVADDPPQHTAFETDAVPGLSELMKGTALLDDVIRPTGVPALEILPIGAAGPEFPGLLLTEECTQHMQALRERYRFVFVDAPSLAEQPATALLAPRADGVVLVVRAGQANKSDVVAMQRMMDGLNVRVYGTVLCDRGGRLKS